MGSSQDIARPRQATIPTPDAQSPRPRPRISFSDASTVRSRVQEAADTVRLTGTRERALRAVLQLLCGWSRVSDDRIRIQQVIDTIAELCGPAHRHDAKTVGRALRDLHREQLITYEPARGRGRCATLAIHDRFLAGIQQLARGADGKVITFSRRRPYISKGVNNPPTPRIRTDSAGRPVGLKINPTELREVLAEAPPVFGSLPKRLRWCLGREIRSYLARGWTAEQVLAILAAPLPGTVTRPLQLARWRLGHNLIGSGPRLAPLQRAWDTNEAESRRTAEHADLDQRWSELRAATTEDTRSRMLAALQARLPGHGGAIVDEIRALVHAGRMACREFPGHPFAAAIDAWVTAHAPARHLHPAEPHQTPEITQNGDCVSCGGADGTVREELPLRSIVCDTCWHTLSAA